MCSFGWCPLSNLQIVNKVSVWGAKTTVNFVFFCTVYRFAFTLLIFPARKDAVNIGILAAVYFVCVFVADDN